MLNKIKILKDSDIQKIAAGEIVERPANILKELIENSLDAKADSITIYIKNAGKDLIKVIDNGIGMNFKDAKLCFEHHATSKIENFSDLNKIDTFGFRGEALSSIASISKINLITKEKDNDLAIQIYIKENKIEKESFVSANNGTEISVEDIFFNIPARRKFLKSKDTEYRVILNLFNAFCFSYLNINFKLYHDDKLVYNYPKVKNLKERFEQVNNYSIKDNILELFNSEKDYKIDGVISHPKYSRYDRSQIYIFVNKRWVKNYKLVQAFIKGYQSMLEVSRFPYGVINIYLNKEEVDINIHPKKEEVQFLYPRVIENLVTLTVKNRLEQNFNKSLNKNIDPARPLSDLNNLDVKNINIFQDIELEKNNTDSNINYKVIGQILKTYIAIEIDNGLTLIDQHAAHERIIYEKLKKSFKDNSKIKLLNPEIIEICKEDMTILNSNLDLFNKVNISIDQISQNSIVIKETPIFFKNIFLKDLIYKIILIIKENYNKDNLSDIVNEKIIAQISCHSAIRSGDVIQLDTINSLIKDLYNTENRLTCPHSRPTLYNLTNSEIEKFFKRNYRQKIDNLFL